MTHRYQSRRALVLGASGFIGRWVARLLTRLGAEVHLGVRDEAALALLRDPYEISGQAHRVDLAQAGVARELCRSVQPAIVFNLAGYGVEPTERDNTLAERLNHALVQELTLALLELRDASWPGRALVHAGSALEYGPVTGPIGPATPSHPTTDYGITKLAGAAAMARAGEQGLRAVEGRIFTAYGPGEHAGRLLPTLLRAQRSGASVPLTLGEQQRDFVAVRDVAESLVRLGLSARPGFSCVNVATGRLRKVREFALAAAGILNISEDRLAFGARQGLAEEMWHGEVSLEALKEEAGYAPALGIEAGIREAVEFMAQKGIS